MINILCTIILISGISGKIQGIVTDKATGEPIPYTNVIILDTQIGTATEEDGSFFILNVPPGRFIVEVSCVGYQTQRIEDIVIKVDHTIRLKVRLEQVPIEIEPITVTYKPPVVEKDMTGTTYIIRESEIATLPIDYTLELISFQPAVARTDTAIHVRGGRATEVLYMIDNVSIIDPQTGDPAIGISKGVVEEVIFLPGGFDAEYGRAMSGVINLITTHPSERFHIKIHGKTEKIMPFYYDFGYENYQSSIHLPVSKKFRGLLSFDLMHTDDWDPRLYKLSHKQRDDYALYSKWLFSPSGKFMLSVSGAKSRIQFDRYPNEAGWCFNLDHWRSDMRKSDLEILNINYLPDTRKLFTLILSRLYTRRIYGVREQEEFGLFEDFKFRDYRTLIWPLPGGSNDNPFGVAYFSLICEGDYPEYQDKSSEILKVNLNTNLQLHKYHEIKGGIEFSYHDLKNFHYYIGDTLHPIADDYQYNPQEFSFFLQDNIDYQGLYAKLGGRYDYFSNDIENSDPTQAFSPRLGVSFKVTDKFLFRANIGRYIQPPLYDYMYSLYNLLPLPSHFQPPGYPHYLLIGNPNLQPEKTTSYEIGLQGKIKPNLFTTVNTYYKDVSELIGTRWAYTLPIPHTSYINVETATIKGIETILEFTNVFFTGKVSYTLSWAKGTSSYAREAYDRYYYRSDADTLFTPAMKEYYLSFDQRHRVFIQGGTQFFDTKFYIWGYFGNGFPYTPPGPEGKYEERNIIILPFQKRIDCLISRNFKIGRLSFGANIEIINLLDVRYQIAPHSPVIDLSEIKPEYFNEYISIHNSYYHPAVDFNHDGLITPFEEYTAYRGVAIASDNWVSAYNSPRRARFGITISFQ